MCSELNEQLNSTEQLAMQFNTINFPPAATSCRCSVTRDPLFDYPATTFYRNIMPSFQEEIWLPGQGLIVRLQNDTSGIESCDLLVDATDNNVIADTWNLTYIVFRPKTLDTGVSSTIGSVVLSGSLCMTRMRYLYEPNTVCARHLIVCIILQILATI